MGLKWICRRSCTPMSTLPYMASVCLGTRSTPLSWVPLDGKCLHFSLWTYSEWTTIKGFYSCLFQGDLVLSRAVCVSALACVIALACAINVASVNALLTCVTVLICIFQDRSRGGKSKKQIKNEAVVMIGSDTQHSSCLLSHCGHLLTQKPLPESTFPL